MVVEQQTLTHFKDTIRINCRQKIKTVGERTIKVNKNNKMFCFYSVFSNYPYII